MSQSSEPSGGQGPLHYAPRWARDPEQARIRPLTRAPDPGPPMDDPYRMSDLRSLAAAAPPPPTQRKRFISMREMALLAVVAMLVAFIVMLIFPRKQVPDAKVPSVAADAGTARPGIGMPGTAPPSSRFQPWEPAANPGIQAAAPTEMAAAVPLASAAPQSPPAAAPIVAAASVDATVSSVAVARPAGPPVRGISDSEIVLGMAAPFSGAAKELGRQMKLGIDTAFAAINAAGGVHGRQLRVTAVDDGYEPTKTVEAMKQLYERDQVFGIIGNVGTPTTTMALPYALQNRMLFFGAFTGAGLLRRDPPDRYVFNYRASYAEETDAVVRYLVKVRGLRPEQIAVFAQQDAYGDAGFAGVTKAIRALRGNSNNILRLNYKRNTVEVDEAVAQLRARKTPIKAVVMVPTYRAAARFIEKTRDLYPGMIYTNVSFVGSTALADELMLLGPKYADGIIVSQVVPAIDSYSSLVLAYKAALAKTFPGESADYVSLEGYVAASLLAEGLRRAGPQVDTEQLVDALESLRGFDMGLGTPLNFGPTEHQASHKIWGTQLGQNGRYQPIDLE